MLIMFIWLGFPAVVTLLSWVLYEWRSEYKKAFAWVPISNLKDWYIQSKNDKNKYATDVLKCSSDGVENEGSFSKMLSRSPITMTRKNFYPIDIYAGINDGYKGSVSIMQSINFYNKITSTDKITDRGDYIFGLPSIRGIKGYQN